MIIVFVVLTAVLGTAETDFRAAQTSYDAYQYDKAIQLLNAMLLTPPSNAKLRQDARALLGFSHYLKRDEANARAALRELLRENVDYVIDREALHPDLVRFYDTERNAYIASLKTTPLQIAQPGGPSEPTLGDRQPWLRVIPLGVGQFVNQDYVTGGIFLGTELALIALNVAGSVWRYSLYDSASGTYRAGAVEAQVLQNVGAIGAIVAAVIGIIDAFVWSPSRHLGRTQQTPSAPAKKATWLAPELIPTTNATAVTL